MTLECASIAIIEDDATIRALLEMALLGAGCRRVTSYPRGDDGLAAVRGSPPDLLLLDLMLPGLDGFTICRRLRESPDTAAIRIVMLTARSESEDIVRGLTCGADDYVTKPFDRAVLLARVSAVLRRGDLIEGGTDFDGLRIDSAGHTVTLDGAEVRLSAGEFTLLERLVSHRGRILPRPPDDRTIDVQVANLRRKLGDWSRHVETIRGVGYRVKP